MKKSIFLFFAAILCAIGAKAFDQSAVDLYFDNSTSQWSECYVYIGHNNNNGWVSCYTMSRVSGTQYLWKLPANFNGGNNWGGATGWVVCKEKWWDSQEEDIYKFVYHGDKNVTNLTTNAWEDSKIYKADGTTTVDHYGQKPTVYKLTTSTKSDYTVTINAVTGGTLTVKDYDDATVSNGASKIKLTVLKFSAEPASGYILEGVQINDGSTTTTISASEINTKTHTLTSNVTITPVWKATTSTVTVTTNATNGTVTGAGVYEEGTSVTLTATADAGYQFKNWTVAGAEVSTANPYTFTVDADITVTANFEELPKVTVYAINSVKWDAIAVHHWHKDGAGTEWPGDLMTNTGEKAPNGSDVYTATFLAEHENCIFNNNGNGSQTGTLDVHNGEYYDLKSNEWYASLAEVPTPDPLATDVFLVGSMNAWSTTANEFKKVEEGSATATLTMNLEAETEYEFKVVREGAWTSSKDNSKITGSVSELVFSSSVGDNTMMTTTVAGDYVFTWNDSKLSITYPASTEPDPTPEVYTVVGGSSEIFGSAWATSETANDMTKQDDGTYKLVKENVTLAAGNIEYKVVKDHNWGNGEYPTQGNLTLPIAESGVYDITFTYTVNASLTATATLKEAVVVLPTIELAGTLNGCDNWNDCKKALTPADDNLTASITVTLAPQEYSFKIVKAGEWLGNKGKMERNSSTGWTFEKLDGGDETNCRIVADATGDYTFTWTYATNTLTVTYPAETGEEIQYTYTVVGPEAMFGTNWDPSNTANDMTKQEDGTYTKTIENVTLAAEATNEYKIVRDHSWDWKELGDANLTFSVDKSGIYNLTFVLNADATKASVTTSLLEETDVVLDAYVAGNEALTGSNFSLEEKNKMTYDSETKTYSHTLTGLKASTYYELKVVHGSSWLGYDKLSTVPQGVTEGNSQNICFQLASDGNLVVTYNATTGITLNGNFYVFDGSNQPSTLYFRPNTAWKSDNARFAAYFFGTTETWVDMTDANGDGIYEVANDKTNANVIFCRMNPSTVENKWDNLLNQTIDIQIPNTTDNPNTVWASWKNVYKESDEDTKLYGTWVVPETIGSGNNSAFYTKYSGQTINVIVERTFEKEVLHTLCLPFSLPAGWIGTAYQLSGVQSNNAEELVLYVKECNTFEAGKPYIVEPTNDELASKEYLLVDNVTISTTLTPNSVSNQTHVVTLKGILNGGGQTDGAIEYYIGTDGALHKDATNKLALRSIVEITDISGNPVQGVRARVAFNENVETGVEDIIATDAPVKVIVNGQLIIIRDGVKYNVQGQKL